MVSDLDLRAALSARVESLDPRTEAELEGVLVRAARRRAARFATYGVGLVAAATALTMLVTQVWLRAETPQPVDEEPARAAVLMPLRGTYDDPAPLEPGLHLMAFEGSVATPWFQVDVPEGWSQDDDMVLTIGRGGDRDTVRIEISSELRGVTTNRCETRQLDVEDGIEPLAQALAETRLSSGPPEPTTLDGHPALQVRLQIPTDFPDPLCSKRWEEIPNHGRYHRTWSDPGWTDVIWIVDVDGRRVVVAARSGPDAPPERVEEMLHMVETATFVDF
jgi:hypothetical protein